MEEKIKTKTKTKTKKINSAIFEFITREVEVEATFIKGLPGFSIVGLASSAVQESRERIKASLLNNNFKFPPLKIVVNLSPANLPKNSVVLDLPIALGILLQNNSVDLHEYLVLGELGLDGTIKETPEIFSIVLGSRYKKIITAKTIAEKLSQIPDIEVYGFSNISEFFDLNEKKLNSKLLKKETSIKYDFIKINGKKYFYTKNFKLDFKDVKGQKNAKRAVLISASGLHNILLEGSPGIGKSMIINRLRYILPPMSFEEILETQKINALENREIDFKPVRPFRMPHHSSSKPAIFGGGSRGIKMGEIGLANNGILFFDELPYFRKDVLESLRLPLQEGKILISRVNSKVEYKVNILFAGAMNPCPCGNLLSKKECRCTPIEIKRYKNRISEPLLDRIDIYVQMTEDSDISTISSNEMFEKVLIAFEKQMKRGYFNSRLPENWQFKIDEEARKILNKAINVFNLSKRAEFKILKVAQTIADLENFDKINRKAILEALNYRKRD